MAIRARDASSRRSAAGVVTLTSGGNNVFTDSDLRAGRERSRGRRVRVLRPFAANGGATLTHALNAGSPALDAANPAHCPAADQRGVARPQGAGCDAGSVERLP